MDWPGDGGCEEFLGEVGRIAAVLKNIAGRRSVL